MLLASTGLLPLKPLLHIIEKSLLPLGKPFKVTLKSLQGSVQYVNRFQIKGIYMCDTVVLCWAQMSKINKIKLCCDSFEYLSWYHSKPELKTKVNAKLYIIVINVNQNQSLKS